MLQGSVFRRCGAYDETKSLSEQFLKSEGGKINGERGGDASGAEVKTRKQLEQEGRM